MFYMVLNTPLWTINLIKTNLKKSHSQYFSDETIISLKFKRYEEILEANKYYNWVFYGAHCCQLIFESLTYVISAAFTLWNLLYALTHWNLKLKQKNQVLLLSLFSFAFAALIYTEILLIWFWMNFYFNLVFWIVMR